MAETTSLYRLQQETTDTITRCNTLLTDLAISGGYAGLYSINDKNRVPRTLLNLYLKALQMWLDWTGVNELFCMRSVERILSKAQQIYQLNCSELIQSCSTDETTNSSIAGDVITNPVVSANNTIVAIFKQFIIGQNSPISAGATSYTLDYISIIPDSISVEMPQANIPQGETNQFSYTVDYNPSNAVITFTNLDESNNNIGVLDGMLFIIRGWRYGGTAVGSLPSQSLPALKIYGDQLTAGVDGPEYDNTTYAGQNLLLYYNGIGYVDIIVKPEGGFIITSMPGPFTHADVFIMTPNGLL